jgi:hypothetical protein
MSAQQTQGDTNTSSPVLVLATTHQPRAHNEEVLPDNLPRKRAVRFDEERIDNDGTSTPEQQLLDRPGKGPLRMKRRKASSYFGDVGLLHRDSGPQRGSLPEMRPETGSRMPKPTGRSGAAAQRRSNMSQSRENVQYRVPNTSK